MSPNGVRARATITAASPCQPGAARRGRFCRTRRTAHRPIARAAKRRGPQAIKAHGLEFHLKVAPGEQHDFLGEFVAGSQLPDDSPDADRCWRTTEATWRSTVPDCGQVIAGPDVRRSVAVLRGMTDHRGGTVAAATTSLPEREDSDSNYDYRFCWIRDTCYVGHAGAALHGGEAILDDAVRWVTERLCVDGKRKHEPGLSQ